MEIVTLADELVLFGYGGKSGRIAVLERQLDLGVTAALLIELALAGRIVIKGKRKLRFDPQPTGIGTLDSVVEFWEEYETTALWKFVREFADDKGHVQVRNRLIAAGLLHERRRRVLGVVTTLRFPSGQDQEAEFHARQRIEEALAAGEAKDMRTALLSRLLGAVELEGAVFGVRSPSRRQGLRDRLLTMTARDTDDSEPEVVNTAAEVLRELQRVVGVFHSDSVAATGLANDDPKPA